MKTQKTEQGLIISDFPWPTAKDHLANCIMELMLNGCSVRMKMIDGSVFMRLDGINEETYVSTQGTTTVLEFGLAPAISRDLDLLRRQARKQANDAGKTWTYIDGVVTVDRSK